MNTGKKMALKIKVLPFTCLKLHFENEVFLPIEKNGFWQLESINYILVGSNGNEFSFKNEVNAKYWIESNLIRASKSRLTKQVHIDALTVKNANTPKDYLALEIETLTDRNLGQWQDNEDYFIDGGNAIN